MRWPRGIEAKVKFLRLSLGLEQHEFGELLGVTAGTIWNWENGKRRPRLPAVRDMVELATKHKMKITIREFLL